MIQFAGRSTELLENGVVDGVVGERILTRGSFGDDWEISRWGIHVDVDVFIVAAATARRIKSIAFKESPFVSRLKSEI